MKDLMVSISGVRGIVGESLTPEILVRLGVAFGTYTRGSTIIVGRDTRVSGEMVKHSVLGGLLATGCRIIDLGIVATPTLTLMVRHLHAGGGVMISASHNPVEWNALKFFRSDGSYLNNRESRDLMDIYYNSRFRHARYDEIRDVEVYPHGHAIHVDAVLSHIDVDAIRAKKFKVALDSCNGSGVFAGRLLLRQLGCEIQEIHTLPDGRFRHYPEPSFVGLTDLMTLCREGDVDIGCAMDPDADRIAFVDENGEFAGEELSLALCADHVFAGRDDDGRGAPLIVNMSTSRVNEDIAEKYGLKFRRVPVGEVNVAEAMAETGAVIGGEGNGGVMFGPVHYGRDALCGIALLLESMAGTGRKLSALVEELPKYYIVKDKLECSKTQARHIIERFSREMADTGGVRVETTDGLRIDWEERWVHVRPSNTEPMLRIIAETPDLDTAKELAADWRKRIEAVVEE